MKVLIKFLVLLCLLNVKCFSQDIGTSPLKMMIEVDTVYTYPYVGLWFQEPVTVIGTFGYGKVYKIKATLRNSGKRKLYYYMMTCSIVENLTIDNDLFKFLFWGCDHNFPMRYELKEGESRIFYVNLIKRFDCFTTKNFTLKTLFNKTILGLDLINNIYDPEIITDLSERMDDKSKRTGIVWSNILDL